MVSLNIFQFPFVIYSSFIYYLLITYTTNGIQIDYNIFPAFTQQNILCHNLPFFAIFCDSPVHFVKNRYSCKSLPSKTGGSPYS